MGLVPFEEESAQSRLWPVVEGVEVNVEMFHGVLLELRGLSSHSRVQNVPGSSVLTYQVTSRGFAQFLDVFWFDLDSFWAERLSPVDPPVSHGMTSNEPAAFLKSSSS